MKSNNRKVEAATAKEVKIPLDFPLNERGSPCNFHKTHLERKYLRQ